MKQQSIHALFLRMLLLLLISPFMAAAKEAASTVWESLPIVERVYGEHNGDVRKNVRTLEDKMVRYQTGLMPDPTHQVPYQNHPFDKQRRRLQENSGNNNGNGNNSTASAASGRFQPIRIHFETVALDERINWEPFNEDRIKCKLAEPLSR